MFNKIESYFQKLNYKSKKPLRNATVSYTDE